MAHVQTLGLCQHTLSAVRPFSSVRSCQRRAKPCRCSALQSQAEVDRRDTLLSLAAVLGSLSVSPAQADGGPCPIVSAWLCWRVIELSWGSCAYRAFRCENIIWQSIAAHKLRRLWRQCQGRRQVSRLRSLLLCALHFFPCLIHIWSCSTLCNFTLFPCTTWSY